MKIQHLGELIGQRVVVTADHGTVGYMVVERHLKARRLAAVGTVKGYVPGHGGDVVFVEQEDTQEGAEPTAVYCHLNELEFYSDEIAQWAARKRDRIRELSAALDRAKQTPFQPMPTCYACGKPSTHDAVDILTGLSASGYLASKPVGNRIHGCDEHPVQSTQHTTGMDLT